MGGTGGHGNNDGLQFQYLMLVQKGQLKKNGQKSPSAEMDFFVHLDLVRMIFTDSYIGACHPGKRDFYATKMARVVKVAPHLLHTCSLGNFSWHTKW